MLHGDRYGMHRVIGQKGILPQPAIRLNNSMDEIYDNEILCDVRTLNVDSASFTQIKKEANADPSEIGKIILSIVNHSGKLKNPITGSGGMFVGTVEKIGEALNNKIDLKVGDRIASLVSLSLTPLKINRVKKIHIDTDQVEIDGKAILFESGLWAKLPDDIDEKLALAVLDVAGAPAQTAKLVRPGDTVLIIGAGGKSGLLCGYEAKKRSGAGGRVIGVTVSEAEMHIMKKSGFFDVCIMHSATDAVGLYEKISEATKGSLCDLVMSNVNIPDCEMAAILSCREDGTVYFFSMATSFTKATLGAEGVGKDINMIMGNGYTKHHADITLNILKESRFIRELYGKRYC
jgi:L-erythro-3,5-diaminohexanoate dehydrogenase